MQIRSPRKATVSELFKGIFFQIPRFQRPYSWDSGNVEDFWIDCIENGGTEYFVGSLVTFPIKKAADPTSAVVDGQQRLTTATLLLCALRNAFRAEGHDKHAEGIGEFVARPDVNAKETFVLDTETSKPFLQEYIQKDSAPEIEVEKGSEEEALQTAFDLLEGKVAEVVAEATNGKKPGSAASAKASREALIEVRSKLLGLELIFIEVEDEDDAYIVFETLNTRGKELEVVDLVKNHLARKIKQSHASVDPTKEKWAEFLEIFESSQAPITPNRFILHAWLSRHPYVSQNRLFKQIHTKVNNRNKAVSYLGQLLAEGTLYRVINEPQSKTDWKKEQAEVRRSLSALALFGIRQPLPLVLSIYRAYTAGDIKIARTKTVLWAIEAFHFQHTIIAGKSSSGGMSAMYARLARELLDAGSQQKRVEKLNEIADTLREKRPTKGEFVEGFKELKLSRKYTNDRQTVAYALRRHYAALGDDPASDLNKMTIEHLVPQSGSKLDDETVARWQLDSGDRGAERQA